MNKIYHIYDSTFKRILTLSTKSVINLINGLFGTNHPTDSTITYNWTEHENKDLKWTLADSILTINNKNSYHMEAQITEDEEIIYLSEVDMAKVSDEYTLTLDFGSQGKFVYKTPVVKLQNIPVEELNERKMIILIPFFLLKLRSKFKKSRSQKNVETLQKLLFNDIIGSIEKNMLAGNISKIDAYNLRDLTSKLYRELYANYEELEELTMRYDQSIRLESDKYEKSIDELEDEVKELKNTIQNMRNTIEHFQRQLATSK